MSAKAFVTAAGLALTLATLGAQSPPAPMPGVEQYRRMAPQIDGAWVSGAVTPRWTADGRAFTYAFRGRSYRFDLASLTAAETTEAAPVAAGPGREASGGPAAAGRQAGASQAQREMPRTPIHGCPVVPIPRGRQAFCQPSPDGRLKAFSRDRNLWIARMDGTGERAVTTDGSERLRIKYGVASWVYGEELSQTTAIWWSPDSRRVAFYRFDESRVPDYALTNDETGAVVDVEAYPLAGGRNPVPDVMVYDVAASRLTTLDVRSGRPFSSEAVGHYVYGVQWRADGREVLLDRADRRQHVVEFAGCSAATGACRTIVREEWPTGWVETDGGPVPYWLADRSRFIWESRRTGWTNYYLYDLDAGLITPLTENAFEAVRMLKVDESAGALFYTARDGDNVMKIQIHRVGLDGRGDARLTDPAFSHGASSCRSAATGVCAISPDNRYVVDVYQRHDTPPSTQLIDASSGKVLAQVARGDDSGLARLGFRRTESFAYDAADGATRLYGQVSFPSKFDPAKRYPVLVPVYGGPTAFGELPGESYTPPDPIAEYGFLVVKVSYRGVPGTGKRGEDALYGHLGRTEVDDIAAGVRALLDRPYVDAGRVGIYGASYGGYVAAMAMVRYPELFAAASASSPVTDWRNYDTIYTERYMGLPQENAEGYEAGKVMTYANRLRGPLLLYYGTADNNVHPANSLQLIDALQRAGNDVVVEVGAGRPHGSVSSRGLMEFFVDRLREASPPRTP